MEEKHRSKCGIIIFVLIVMVVIIIGSVFIVNTIVIPQNNYNMAISLIDSKQYKEAYNVLTVLGDYKDSQNKRDGIKQLAYADMLKKADVGETLFLGTYEQDNVISNGKEDIEWLVLDKIGSTVLVISKYGLDYKKMNGLTLLMMSI